VTVKSEGNGANWASKHRASAAKYTALPSFFLIAKLLNDLS
jgi:hypothetical protein